MQLVRLAAKLALGVSTLVRKQDVRLPSGKELIVLELLVARREMYGLEMVKEARGLRRGTVYVLLNRMEDRGYIKSRQVKEEGTPGMPLRVYSISGLGQRALGAWRQAQAAFGLVPGPVGGR
jgi:DNA-binding PadR family transcriptional regulator